MLLMTMLFPCFKFGGLRVAAGLQSSARLSQTPEAKHCSGTREQVWKSWKMVFQMVNKLILTNAPILLPTNANNPIFCLETEIQSRFLSIIADIAVMLPIWLNTDTAAEQIPMKIPARRESASPII